MKKLKLRKWVKYLLLFIITFIILKLFIRDADTYKNYCINFITIFYVIVIDFVLIIKIEK